MISKILLTGLATFFLSGGIITLTEDCHSTSLLKHSDQIQTTEVFTKAIQYDGEFIPMVELPVLEVTGKRNTGDLVHAILVDGEIYPSLMLDEIVVQPGA